MPLIFSTPSTRRRVLPNQWDLLAFAVIMAALTAIAHSYHGISAPLPAANEPVDLARLLEPALLRAAHRFAHVRRAFLLSGLHLHLCDAGGQEPAMGDGADPCPRHLAVGADPGLPVLHRDASSSASFPAICSARNWRRSSPSSPARPGTWLFRFYQSLRTVPRDLDEVARGFRLTGWQKFWQLEAPFAMPGLIWNTMMSMSGGWFFVVASEAITVGDTTITLPGVGSYIAKANDAGRLVGDRRGGRDHGDRHPALRSVAVPADRRLGRQVQGRTVGEPGGRELLGAEPAAAHLLDPPRRPPGLRGVAQRSACCRSACRALLPDAARRSHARRRASSTSLWIALFVAVAVYGAVDASSPISRPSSAGPRSATSSS